MLVRAVLVSCLAMASVSFCADDSLKTPPGECSACKMSLTVQRAAGTQQTKQISEVDSSYISPNVTILVGDTVTWTNNGDLDHTTTSDNGLWDSGRMHPGKSFSHTFKQTGVY